MNEELQLLWEYVITKIDFFKNPPAGDLNKELLQNTSMSMARGSVGYYCWLHPEEEKKILKRWEEFFEPHFMEEENTLIN